MQKYIFLYNINTDYESYDEIIKNKILKAIPEAVILKGNYMMNKVFPEGESIWVPEEKYLIAWTIVNYKELLDISFINNLEGEVNSDDGVKWFNMHKDDEFYVKYMS